MGVHGIDRGTQKSCGNIRSVGGNNGGQRFNICIFLEFNQILNTYHIQVVITMLAAVSASVDGFSDVHSSPQVASEMLVSVPSKFAQLGPLCSYLFPP